MIPQREIQSIANELSVRDVQIEKDYVITWVLYGISNNDYLKQRLVFKGGTLLKKVYFPDYRFSEDLDFTYVNGDFNREKFDENLVKLKNWLYKEARIKTEVKDNQMNKTNNYQFYLSYIGPLGGKGAHKSIKVDISLDELLYTDPITQPIESDYTDISEDFEVKCYTLEEAIAEKMRSVMQRTEPRDLYDLWQMFEVKNKEIRDFVFAFQEKAEHKNKKPANFVSVLQKKEKTFNKLWDQHLKNQMKEVPDFDDVWRELGSHMRDYNEYISD